MLVMAKKTKRSKLSGLKLGGGAGIALSALSLVQNGLPSSTNETAMLAGNMAGGVGGAMLGATLGSVVPVIGTALGGILGAFLDQWAVLPQADGWRKN